MTDCAQADLIVKITLDTLSDSVSLLVTNGDSGDSVFSETRTIQDKRSDLIHAAQHFRDAVKSVRFAAEEEQARLAAEYRQRQETEAKKREQQRCQSEFNSLKQKIVEYSELQEADVPLELNEQIATHNGRCTNPITLELVKDQTRAEIAAKAAEEQAAREQAAREKRAAQLEKVKADALVDWTNRLVSAPWVPPVEGCTHESGLSSVRWYIILPKTGLASNCHFAMNGDHPALDCLGSEGRNDYVSVFNNGHLYLLKGKRINGRSGDHASTVKDGGLTLCLRQSGCYHVLAELRQEPTELPERVEVPPPDELSMTYSGDDVACNYPHNWKAEEKKSKDNMLVQVNIAPPGAHLATWVTHGLLIGHVLKSAGTFPHTLDGAYDQFSEYERQRGLVISDAQMQAIGDSHGKLATYTSPSVFKANENGWIAVVKDRGDGYYYLQMFYPSNDDVSVYARTFTRILETFKFKK